ncbi:MAG: hypothetical protein K6T77_04195 [candidate division WOR-3 bacterium]|jgi:hypothetical protein|nr:hypothetical protein [candidate division WOR-3 bacterium]MCR4423291.1 hypothetical protein [candidate division WOR-3 bacterium]MDH7518630.1 hypothetical protein [bacterium]
MALIVIFSLCILPGELLDDMVPSSPDKEDLYETLEDSLAQQEDLSSALPRSYRLLLRMGYDSFPANGVNCRAFTRIRGFTKEREIVLLVDKDRGENNWMDFIGGGVSLSGEKWRFTAGDFLLSFGCGLILTAPSARISFLGNLGPESKSSLAQTAQENRNLRGIKVSYNFGFFTGTVFGSYTLRDAVLNSDGTVQKITFSGVHDSASQINKNQLGQKLVGGMANYQGRVLKLGVAGYGVNFDRPFSPRDTLESFYGRTMGGLSLYAGYGNNSRYGDIEVAQSFTSTSRRAVAGRLGFDTNKIRVQIRGTIYQSRFFSPAGRIYSLTGRRERFDLSGNISYKLKYIQFGLSGNTQRDYLVDSIPARININAAFQNNGIEIHCLLGRIYRMEQERSRRARVEVSTKWRRARFGLLVEDEYADYSGGQGLLVSLSSGMKIGNFGTDFAVSRFIISGRGVGLTVREPGAMRIGSSYSSNNSAWRIAIAGYWRQQKVGRLGIKLGAVYTEVWKFDLNGQFELEAKCG